MDARSWCLGFAAVTAAGLAWLAFGRQPTPSHPPSSSAAAEPLPLPVGTASCSARGCHGGLEPLAGPIGQDEYTTWLSTDTRHANACRVLHNDRSQRIAQKLDIPAAEKDSRCLACHVNPVVATNPAAADLREKERYFGIGCESCHGPAEKWRVAHTTQEWKNRDPKAKAKDGMIPVADPRAGAAAAARACAGCHVGAPPAAGSDIPRDVNHDLIAAGHPRLNFEYTVYRANLPRHWKEKTKAPSPAEQWLVGQAAAVGAFLELLAYRAGAGPKAPWPEFAAYNCFACHHDLREPSWRQHRKSGKPLGRLELDTWYLAMPRFLVGHAGDLKLPLPRLPEEIAAQMRRAYPERRDIAKQAGDTAKEWKLWLEEGKQIPPDEAAVRKALLADGANLAEADWDSAIQLYLALAASSPDPSADELRQLAKLLAYDDPRDYRPIERFDQRLQELLNKISK